MQNINFILEKILLWFVPFESIQWQVNFLFCIWIVPFFCSFQKVVLVSPEKTKSKSPKFLFSSYLQHQRLVCLKNNSSYSTALVRDLNIPNFNSHICSCKIFVLSCLEPSVKRMQVSWLNILFLCSDSDSLIILSLGW